MKIGRFEINRNRAQWGTDDGGRILLTAVADDRFENRRFLWLVRNDFRNVYFKIPWRRSWWPRRNFGA